MSRVKAAARSNPGRFLLVAVFSGLISGWKAQATAQGTSWLEWTGKEFLAVRVLPVPTA